jgi:hypothetical protein
VSKNNKSKNLIEIGGKAARAMSTKTIIKAGVGAGVLIELDPETQSPTGLYRAEKFTTIFRERHGIAENYQAQKTISQDIKSQLRLQIQHVAPSESACGIAPPGIVVGIPTHAGHVEVWWFTIQCKPGIAPYAEIHIPFLRQGEIFAHVDEKRIGN